MNPSIIRHIVGSDAVSYFCAAYGLQASAIRMLKLRDGAANLYYYVPGECGTYLRISYRKDRDIQMIESELDFLGFMAEHGYPSPKPIKSLANNICETYRVKEHVLTAALFSELEGKHLHQMQFRLPQGVNLMQFWQECGKALGMLHALSHKYQALHEIKRFTWLDRHEQSLSFLFPVNPLYRDLLLQVIAEIGRVPHSPRGYGLCHNDFNVGNFLIDYDSSEFELKLIDFDDSGFNYYMYDLACFWEMSTGWAINLAKACDWAEYMHRCYSIMLEEYYKYFNPDFDAQGLLPTFLKAVHIENSLESLRELHYSKKALVPGKQISYHLHCLKHGIEFLGLYEDFFDPNDPFSLA